VKNSLIPILVTAVILSSAFITSVAAGQSSNEKIPVIIGFKDKSDAALVKAHGGDIKYQYHAIPAIAASIPVQAINGLKNNPNVAYIEEDAIINIFWVEDNDTETPWGVDRIDAEKAHTLNFTGEGVKVAIIDTGIDYTHPDLAANYAGGYNFIKTLKTPMDDNGHGTHVAGIIAAGDNDTGVVGVAPDAELYALKALGRTGSGYISDVNEAIDWAIDNNMDVISMSLGSSYNSTSQHALCDAAYEKGIVIVASAGNDYGGAVSYPAAYDSVIAVSATNYTDGIAYFSSTGPEVELAAPGVHVNSTYLGGTYTTLSGTSMAAPHVSGVVALLLGANSTMSPSEIREILANTSIDLGPEGKDNYFGYGLLDAATALEGFSADPNPETDPELKYTVELSELLEKAGGKFVYKTATVNVTDVGNNSIPGATVNGHWIINDGNPIQVLGTTDSSGVVIFTSPKVKTSEGTTVSFKFEVTSVTVD